MLKCKFSVINDPPCKHHFGLRPSPDGFCAAMLYSLDKNKGIAIETLHYLNDGLWRTTEID